MSLTVPGVQAPCTISVGSRGAPLAPRRGQITVGPLTPRSELMLTPRIEERLREDYPIAQEHAVAHALVKQIESELSVWREVSEGDRVEVAALTVAARDLAKLQSAVTLALHDWRDLLVSAGHA